MSRAISSSVRKAGCGVASVIWRMASRARARPGVLAVRKNSLSSCCGTMALSRGNKVPRVLPIPVLAWAIRQRPVLTALYRVSASCRWPWRNAG
ncbi:hypothetical protein D3C75_1118590 [compost metagenome]